MATLKTQANDASVKKCLDGIEDENRRQDCEAVLAIMQEATGEEPVMWGDGIIGFGSYHYKYASGREGDWFLTGFASRKANLTLYIMPGFNRYESLMGKLGKHKTGKSCLYIDSLADLDIPVLKELVKMSADHMARTSAPQ